MPRLMVALVLCLGAAAPAQAQVYSWRDVNGALVISDRPAGGPAAAAAMTTYAVRGTAQVRTTTPLPRLSPRALAYDEVIEAQAAAAGISAALVRAVIQAESAFNPAALSPKGAMGLMQLMPATARELGVENPFDTEQNIRGGVTYLARLLTRFDQNVELALAAYNAGPGSVERYGNAVPPYRETQAYVRKIAGTAQLPPPPPKPRPLYKWVEDSAGKSVTRYSDVAPVGVSYETIVTRTR